MILTCSRKHSSAPLPRLSTFVSLAAALVLACLLSAPASADTTATQPGQQLSDSDSLLRALLWLRTSGEYQALCLQTFNAALAQVRAAVKASPASKVAKPFAVVMDLDETVLDTSGYSVYLLNKGLRHHEAHWLKWSREHMDQIGLVPGAKQFIKDVESEGIYVVFISNRSDTGRDGTIRILRKFDVATQAALDDPNGVKLLLRTETSSKQSRRDKVNNKYTVIALLGDNLNDFSNDFRAPAVNSIEERRAMVRKHGADWGSRWYVLPNPIYGNWTRYIDWNNAEQYLEHPAR
jgi:5'-nucleotidase (lipoprotein e(P4) family)